MQKPKLSFWQIWNMSFGFLGIQFGFALQGGFMSRIFQTLGAGENEIPLLWIAAPLTGLIVQPIIGFLSDRTWHPRFGRRRPYFLIGAILSSVTLFFVPHSPVLWVAAGCLWILDASINISMEPFRALVADKLPDEQRSYGFVMQTLIIGIGTWVASNLPLMVSSMGVSNEAAPGIIPDSVKIAFAIGGFVFLISILYTVFTTKEYPPANMEAFKAEKEENKGIGHALSEITKNIVQMPSTMAKLGVVQFFSWFAFFAMWSLATPALTEHVFKSPKPVEISISEAGKEELLSYTAADKKYNDAADLGGSYMGFYGLSSMGFALLLTLYTSRRKINRRWVHLVSLLLGGLGFISMYFIHDHKMLIMSFVLVGISWGSILSMPYAMLSSSIDPAKMGMYMGLFNMFIVLPQITAATGGLNFLYRTIFGESGINAMLLAGSSLIIAGLCNLLITDKKAVSD
ncbi:MAG: MFS transporter [Owenweeksia sp.]|nr:MFS transporter [Owenweeksia sp.]